MQHINSLLFLGRNWSVEPLENVNWSGSHQPLRVVTVHDPVFLSTKLLSNGSYMYSGYLYDLWKIVASTMSLNYQMVPLAVSDYGVLDANGTWTGLVGELTYGRADVALASLDMTADRAAAIDYLSASPVDQAKYWFFVRRGFRETPELSSLLSSLLKPLDTNVWWTLLVSLLILTVVLRISLHFNRGRAESQQTVDELPWTACLLSSYMSMVRQGWSTTPNSLAVRAVIISSWVLGIIIYASYTANLISHLTVITEELPINSLEEFLERPDWTLAVPIGASQLDEWRSSSDVHERALYQRYATGKDVIQINVFSNASISTMIRDRVLTFEDFKYVSALHGPDACLLAPLPGGEGRPILTFIAMTKGMDRLRRRMNQLLLTMETTGLISRLKRRWKKSSEIICENPTGYKAISFGDSLAVLVLVPLSMCASMVLLVLERASSVYSTR